ncbi:MAG: hypothetical protein M3Y56_01260 [Armatimonadota bacterium]|nr:hypothetical protein [Armatimonadota bacterium]
MKASVHESLPGELDFRIHQIPATVLKVICGGEDAADGVRLTCSGAASDNGSR